MTDAMKNPDKMSERELRAEVKFLRGAIERLASTEAFDVARSITKPKDNELLARIFYAEQVLAQLRNVGKL